MITESLPMTRVGFIGLGSQGAPMAKRIVDAGYPVVLWARRAESLEPFRETAATVASSPKELAANCDVVCVCVVSDADVDDVLQRGDGVLAGLAAGGIVVVHSTIHPDTSRRLGTVASTTGVTLIDAPVSGGGHSAAAGRLLVMTGGPLAAVERCRPILETFANPIVHVGELGDAQIAKLLNNLVFTAQVTLAIETFATADALGIDRAALAQVIASGTGGSRAAAILAATNVDLSGLRGAVGLLRKDVGLASALLDETNRPPEIMRLAAHTLTTLT